METLLYALGFIIGALGTAFLLYFLKTRKTLRQQHEINGIPIGSSCSDKEDNSGTGKRERLKGAVRLRGFERCRASSSRAGQYCRTLRGEII